MDIYVRSVYAAWMEGIKLKGARGRVWCGLTDVLSSGTSTKPGAQTQNSGTPTRVEIIASKFANSSLIN